MDSLNLVHDKSSIIKKSDPTETNKSAIAFKLLEHSVYNAIKTYSNVHRGSGHFSQITTHLFEQARKIILNYLGLNNQKYQLIFGSKRHVEKIKAQLISDAYTVISTNNIGLALGLYAIAIKRNQFTKLQGDSGGGTTRVMSTSWIKWSTGKERLEAGTPSVINAIAFAKALQLITSYGNNIFLNEASSEASANHSSDPDEIDAASGYDLLLKLRKKHIGRDILVPTQSGEQRFVNLDNSASTPTFEPIWQAYRSAWQVQDDKKTEIIQKTQNTIRQFLDAPAEKYDVIFTSNTTESINIVAEDFTNKTSHQNHQVIVSSMLEHSSNDLPWRAVPNHSVIRLSINEKGFYNLQELEHILKDYNEIKRYPNQSIRLVSISGASNVLGTTNNLHEISRLVHQYGAELMVDAAQLVAHRSLSMESAQIDYLVFSAHKIYAPFGTGVLIVRKGLLSFPDPELKSIKKSGEENVGGMAALGRSLYLLQKVGMNGIEKEEQRLTNRLLKGLKEFREITTYGIQEIYSEDHSKRVSVVPFTIKNSMADKFAGKLAQQGAIGIRYGCHCAHITVKHMLGISPFLEQFQRLILTLFPKLQLPGVARVSLGIENTDEDIEQFLETLKKIIANSNRANKSKDVMISDSEIQKNKQFMLDYLQSHTEKVFSNV